MNIRSLVAALVIPLCSVPAFAQDVITLPTTRPVPPEETRPEGRVIDVVGIQIGDTFDEARKKLVDRLGEANVQMPSEVSILGDTTGNQISFGFRSQLLGEMPTSDGGRDMIEVYFTPSVTEERVVSIHRTVYSANQDIDIRQVISGLEQKYGPVSWQDSIQGGKAYWIWHSGQHVQFASDPMSNDTTSPEACALWVHQGGYSFGLTPVPPNCDMRIHIMFVPGRLDGLAASFIMDVVDYKRLGIAMEATDAALNKAFEDYLATIGGTAPDL